MLLTFNRNKQQFWWQKGSNRFQVGQIMSSFVLDTLIKEARSSGATILDTTDIDKDVLDRLIRKFFNRRGYVDDAEMYAEALKLNGAKEITE